MKHFRSIFWTSILAIWQVLGAATVEPTSLRIPPSAMWARHTALPGYGTGRPGGIAQFRPGGASNRTISDLSASLASYNGTGVDCRAVIQAAINAAIVTSNVCVLLPAGVFTVSSGEFINPTGGIPGAGTNTGFSFTVRGAGMNRTILKLGNNHAMFNFGTGSGYTTPTTNNTASAVLAKGATTVTIGDASPFTVNQFMRLVWQNQTDDATISAGAIPVFHNEGLPEVRLQTVRVVSKASNTITFSPPVLHTPDSNLYCKLYASTTATASIGLEDLTIDGDIYGGSTAGGVLVQFQDAIGCWMLNVEVKHAKNYNVSMFGCYRNEIRGCYIHSRLPPGGTSGSGILMRESTGMLVEDNIMHSLTPCWEINGSVGSTFAHNFVDGEANINHGPWNYGNLYCRNIVTLFKSDGYFGGAQSDTLIGNWQTGMYDVKLGTPGRTGFYAYKRFLFQLNALGNVHGMLTDPLTYNASIGFGKPNIGNDATNGGTSEFLAGVFPRDWKQTLTLTTRTNDNNGIFTRNGTSEMVTGNIKVLVGPLGYLSNIVALTASTWSFTTAATLGAVSTVYDLTAPGPGGYQEQNDDVWNTAMFTGNMKLSPNVTFPSQPWTPGDQIVEYLGNTTAPAGTGVDAVNWGSCPWYTNGQYGFIDRDNPSALTLRDLPAGRRYMDNTIFGESTGNATVSGTITAGTITVP